MIHPPSTALQKNKNIIIFFWEYFLYCSSVRRHFYRQRIIIQVRPFEDSCWFGCVNLAFDYFHRCFSMSVCLRIPWWEHLVMDLPSSEEICGFLWGGLGCFICLQLMLRPSNRLEIHMYNIFVDLAREQVCTSDLEKELRCGLRNDGFLWEWHLLFPH